MPRGLQALALRATLLAISARVTSTLVVGRQSVQTHIGEDPSLPNRAYFEFIDETADCEHIENKSAQSYILLGAMDSGTNLLHQMMYASWPSEVCMEDGGFAWKHSLTGAKEIYHYLLKHKDRDAWKKSVVLHAVRSPISQMGSWRHMPYELDACVTRDVAYWHQPCIAPMGPWHKPEGGTEPTVYNSTMEVYQQYLRQLEELREAGWFKAVVSVAYEDLILSPTETLTDIAKHFDGIKKVQKADVEAAMQRPAKYQAATADDELAKLAQRTYLQNYSAGDVKIICNGLNKTLVERYHAGNFLEPSRRVSYWFDCAHV